MKQIRRGMFETNSSSCNTFIYRRELTIPTTLKIDSKLCDTIDYYHCSDEERINAMISDYYKRYGNNLIAFLFRKGVQNIFIDEVEIKDKPEQNEQVKMFNSACESHNNDISDEDMLLYNLFGELVEQSNNRQGCYNLMLKYKDNPNFVYSDWFI